MKKTLILLSGFMVAFSLTACSDEEESKGVTNKEPIKEEVVQENPNELVLNVDGEEKVLPAKTTFLSGEMDLKVPEGFDVDISEDPEEDDIIIGKGEYEGISIAVQKIVTSFNIKGEKLADNTAKLEAREGGATSEKMDISKYPELKKFQVFYSSNDGDTQNYIFTYSVEHETTMVKAYIPVESLSPETEELIMKMAASLEF